MFLDFSMTMSEFNQSVGSSTLMMTQKDSISSNASFNLSLIATSCYLRDRLLVSLLDPLWYGMIFLGVIILPNPWGFFDSQCHYHHLNQLEILGCLQSQDRTRVDFHKSHRWFCSVSSHCPILMSLTLALFIHVSLASSMQNILGFHHLHRMLLYSHRHRLLVLSVLVHNDHSDLPNTMVFHYSGTKWKKN